MDDFYRVMDADQRAGLTPEDGYRRYYDWERLEEQVLRPLSRGESCRYQQYDWDHNCLGKWVEVRAEGMVLIEGCYAARSELKAYYQIIVLVETAAERRSQRQSERADATGAWVERWEAAERFYMDQVQPTRYADFVISGEPTYDLPQGQPLARGRTADLYSWENNQVLKLFHSWFGLDKIQYEAEIARAIAASGVQAAAVGEIISFPGDRHGLVYEYVNGQSMFERMRQKPWQLFHLARCLATVHARMHERVPTAALPQQHRRLENKIRQAASLLAQIQSDVLAALVTMPAGDRVCHGDFHPGNLLLPAEGAVAIDWIDATVGNPLADVARTTIVLQGAVAGDQIHGLLPKLILRAFHAAYLRHYFRLCPGGEEEYRRWLPIVAAARVSEQIPELEAWLIRRAQE